MSGFTKYSMSLASGILIGSLGHSVYVNYDEGWGEAYQTSLGCIAEIMDPQGALYDSCPHNITIGNVVGGRSFDVAYKVKGTSPDDHGITFNGSSSNILIDLQNTLKETNSGTLAVQVVPTPILKEETSTGTLKLMVSKIETSLFNMVAHIVPDAPRHG